MAAGEDARALFVEKVGESPSFEVNGATDTTMVSPLSPPPPLFSLFSFSFSWLVDLSSQQPQQLTSEQVCLDAYLHFLLMEVMKNSMAAVLQNHKVGRKR